MLPGKINRRSFLAMSSVAAACFALDPKKVAAFSARMGDKKDYPCVVIGAGLGGLTCAAYLAKQGIPVTLIEKHNIPGGYATSFERGQGRFNFEVSLHATAAGNNNAEERVLKNLGVWEKAPMALLPEQYTVMTPGLTLRVPQKDPQGYARLLAGHFPKDAEGIAGFVGYMEAVARESQKIMQDCPTLEGAMFYLSFPFKYRAMLGLINRTVDDILDRYKIQDPRARDILATTWPYYGLPPSKLSAGYFINPTGDFMINGAFYIKKRSQSLSDALAGVIEGHGGKIIYETEADKILVQDGAVTGVSAGGRTYPARAVVSNASALTTFRDMLPKGSVPAYYMKKLNSYPVSLSSFIVWLGLNQDITDRIKDYEIFIGTGKGPDADYKAFVEGDVENMQFLVAVYDNAYKGYSEPGTSTLSIVVLTGYGPWRPFEADYKAGHKDAYNHQKNLWKDTLIRRVEQKLIPGLSSMIEVSEAATPLTNRRYTGHPMGAIYGFDHGLDNDFVTRIKNRTPVKGLYLASAWGNPGAGYGGVILGGELTFYQMMKDWGA